MRVGLGLGLAVSVKWVGLFAFAPIGLFTIKELWDMICNTSIPIRYVFRHFLSRFVCLLVLPLFIYLGIFYAHLGFISTNLEAANLMTPGFFYSLGGKSFVPDTFKGENFLFGSELNE